MAIDLYKGFSNPITRETFTCIHYDIYSIRFLWKLEPGGYVPFEHLHLEQDETFYVKKGELRVRVEGREHIIGEGQKITVPRGKRHIAFNNLPSDLTCEIEYHPGLDSYTFFQCFAGLTIDRNMKKDGSISIPKMLYFSRKMKARCMARPTKIPAPLFYSAMNFFYLVGSLAGWKKQYKKYTGLG